MKNKLHHLPKELRLMLLLGLMALMVLCLWLEADTPAFSPNSGGCWNRASFSAVPTIFLTLNGIPAFILLSVVPNLSCTWWKSSGRVFGGSPTSGRCLFP